MTERKNQAGQFVYVTPVAGVELSKEVGHEYRIDRVTLLTVKRFLSLRRFKFVFKKWRSHASTSDVCQGHHAVAITLMHGEPEQVRRQAHRLIKEELNILSCARMGYHNRKRKGIVSIADCMDSYGTDDLLLGRDVDLMQSSGRMHTIECLRLNDEFVRVAEGFHLYRKLLTIIRGGGEISNDWRRVIRNAAELAGRSQNSVELADAFLWNMIALDQLLLFADDTRKHRQLLTERCAALFGHCALWTKADIGEWIENVYKARCKLVHDGDRAFITVQHLIHSDVLLANVIRNIVLNLSHFPSKNAIRTFTEQVNARVVLGKNPRPPTWRWWFSILRYDDKDLAEYWAL